LVRNISGVEAGEPGKSGIGLSFSMSAVAIRAGGRTLGVAFERNVLAARGMGKTTEVEDQYSRGQRRAGQVSTHHLLIPLKAQFFAHSRKLFNP